MNNSDVESTDGDSSFVCDKCEQKFNTQQELKEHGRSINYYNSLILYLFTIFNISTKKLSRR